MALFPLHSLCLPIYLRICALLSKRQEGKKASIPDANVVYRNRVFGNHFWWRSLQPIILRFGLNFHSYLSLEKPFVARQFPPDVCANSHPVHDFEWCSHWPKFLGIPAFEFRPECFRHDRVVQ